jgi:uncharacterized protein (TIGR03000 family)
MYSMVMMMALTGGAATPAWHGGGGCYGGDGCWGAGYSCGGGYACNGGGHRLFGGGHRLFGRRGHGCDGGCYGGCYGGGYGGCYGGGGYGHGCFGYGYGCSGYGCYGAGIGHGCVGGAPMPPPPPPPDKKMKEGKKPDGGSDEVSAAAPATLVVSLPADAKLTIDDTATISNSASRVFVTPALETGKEFRYTLKAAIVRDGQSLTTTKLVTVRAGEETRVALEFPLASVAQR